MVSASDPIPFPTWLAGAALLLVLVVGFGSAWVLQAFVGPWLLDVLGVRWVPITGGYFVVESISPLAWIAPWGGLVVKLGIIGAGAWLTFVFIEKEPTSEPIPFGGLEVPFVEMSAKNDDGDGDDA